MQLAVASIPASLADANFSQHKTRQFWALQHPEDTYSAAGGSWEERSHGQ
jgi:hypothetical protein